VNAILGFHDKDMSTYMPRCRAVQNSYQLMLAALGPWPGGPRPNPFSASPTPSPSPMPDAGAGQDAAAPSNVDAAREPTGSNSHPDAANAASRHELGGTCAVARRAPAALGPFAPALALAAAGFLRLARRRGRRSAGVGAS
jgi:hypothetical protein